MSVNSPISLRGAEPCDADLLYALFVASRERELAPLPPAIRDVLAKQQYEVHRRGVTATFPEARVMIVLGPATLPGAAREPLGMVILAERPPVLWVVDLAVHPNRRNKGVGSAVLTRLMEECRRKDWTIRGSVAPYNPARRLYARLGIEELGLERGYVGLAWRTERAPPPGQPASRRR